MNTKRFIPVTILIIIAATVIYVCSEYNRENADMSVTKADAAIDATSLISAFHQDSAAAGKKYIDKVVKVTGLIKSIDTSGVIALGNPSEMSSVQCMMDKRHAVDYNALKEGMNISITGKCNGYQTDELLGTDVKMNFCVINN